MIRAVVTFVIVTVVLFVPAGMLGWLGTAEVLILLLSSGAITAAVTRVRARERGRCNPGVG